MTLVKKLMIVQMVVVAADVALTLTIRHLKKQEA